jgi:DNA-binding NarL/FixJ family response regulator
VLFCICPSIRGKGESRTQVDRVIVCCDDMFFRVNIEARIRAAGLMPVPVTRLVDLESQLSPDLAGGESRIRAAIVDLHARGGAALELIAPLAAARPGLPILAFGAHVEREPLERARRAGATAIPRSRFVREFPGFLESVALGVSPRAPDVPPE